MEDDWLKMERQKEILEWCHTTADCIRTHSPRGKEGEKGQRERDWGKSERWEEGEDGWEHKNGEEMKIGWTTVEEQWKKSLKVVHLKPLHSWLVVTCVNPDTVTHTNRGRPGFIRQVVQARLRERKREQCCRGRTAGLWLCSLCVRLSICVVSCCFLSVSWSPEDEWCCWRLLCRLVLIGWKAWNT